MPTTHNPEHIGAILRRVMDKIICLNCGETTEPAAHDSMPYCYRAGCIDAREKTLNPNYKPKKRNKWRTKNK